MRMIDADDLIRELQEQKSEGEAVMFTDMIDIVKEQPTATPVQAIQSVIDSKVMKLKNREYVSRESAVSCYKLLKIYFGDNIRIINLGDTTERILQLAHDYDIDEKTSVQWLSQEIEQTCLLPV